MCFHECMRLTSVILKFKVTRTQVPSTSNFYSMSGFKLTSQRHDPVFSLVDTSDPKNIVKFLKEGLIMKTFDHPNVLGLLGLTYDMDDNPLLVLPFMANGDLKTFFAKKKQVTQ